MGYKLPMKTCILLAVHGAPPSDFPRQELAEYLGLHARAEHAAGPREPGIEDRHAALEAKIRAWPRTPSNDPFHAGSLRIAAELEKASGLPVVVGFNEFCGPSLGDALDRASAAFEKVVVVTPMLTSGGAHAQADIPAEIGRAQGRHPKTRYLYAWPFPAAEVGAFLAARVRAAVTEGG